MRVQSLPFRAGFPAFVLAVVPTLTSLIGANASPRPGMEPGPSESRESSPEGEAEDTGAEPTEEGRGPSSDENPPDQASEEDSESTPMVPESPEPSGPPVAPAPARAAPAPTHSTEVNLNRSYSLTSSANLRQAPTLSSTLILTVPKNATVRVLGVEGARAKVRYLHFEGWVLRSLLGTEATASTTPVVPGRTTTATLRLRKGPSTSQSVLASMPKGAVVQVLGWKSGWHLVRYNEATGWAATSFLRSAAPTLFLKPTTANVNMRARATAASNVVMTLPKGATVAVQEEGKSWSRVSYQGHTGWVTNNWIGTTTARSALPKAEYKYTTTRLNLRSGSSTSTKILTAMPAGAKVRVLGWQGTTWRLLRYNNTTGWAMAKYLGDELPYRATVKYRVITNGTITTSLDTFRRQVQETLDDPRGWRGKGIRFQRVTSGGSMVVVLANSSRVRGYAPAICGNYYSCRVGNYVIINQDRWKGATASWNNAGGSLRNYRHMVVNHEVGHWLDNRHDYCSGPGKLAPVMQQQSISLQGCKFNPWPLSYERTPRFP